MNDQRTIAQQAADLLDNDGSHWTASTGEEFDDLMARLEADVEYSVREYMDEADEHGSRERYVSGSRSSHGSGDPIRYVFADRSAIVAAGDCWDREGATPFSFLGA